MFSSTRRLFTNRMIFHPPIIVEFLGFSGYGKSTIAQRVSQELIARGIPVDNYDMQTQRRNWSSLRSFRSWKKMAVGCADVLLNRSSRSPRRFKLRRWMIRYANLRGATTFKGVTVFTEGALQVVRMGAYSKILPVSNACHVIVRVLCRTETVVARLKERARKHPIPFSQLRWLEEMEEPAGNANEIKWNRRISEQIEVLNGLAAMHPNIITIVVRNNNLNDLSNSVRTITECVEAIYRDNLPEARCNVSSGT